VARRRVLVYNPPFPLAKSLNRSVSRFVNDAEVLPGGGIRLPVPVEYGLGQYVCIEKPKEGPGDSYDFGFTEKHSGRENLIPVPKGPFTVSVGSWGEGLIRFPAVHIRSRPYEDVLLLFMDASGETTGEGVVEVASEDELATLSFRGSGGSITGRVSSSLTRSRKVRVEVYHREVPRNVFLLGEGPSFEFSRRLLPEESTLIITFYLFGPGDFLELWGAREALLGHGEYVLRLTLDRPWRFDVHGEGGFEVVP
jgi:hypothetical protein